MIKAPVGLVPGRALPSGGGQLPSRCPPRGHVSRVEPERSALL